MVVILLLVQSRVTPLVAVVTATIMAEATGVAGEVVEPAVHYTKKVTPRVDLVLTEIEARISVITAENWGTMLKIAVVSVAMRSLISCMPKRMN